MAKRSSVDEKSQSFFDNVAKRAESEKPIRLNRLLCPKCGETEKIRPQAGSTSVVYTCLSCRNQWSALLVRGLRNQVLVPQDQNDRREDTWDDDTHYASSISFNR